LFDIFNHLSRSILS